MELIRRVRPTPTDAYLANPHRGCCTFQRFNGDELFPGESWSEEGPTHFPPRASPHVIEGYLPSTVAYCRWFWKALEPREGEYDFSPVERAMATAAERGQTLAVRLMAFGASTQPQVPDWYAARHPMLERPMKGAAWRVPAHEAEEYLRHWGGLAREFGRRFDGDPLLETIDLSYIGPWGEGDGDCGAARCRDFAELWREAFPRTPRLALVGGEQMRAGIASGAGWRCDCFGDCKDWGSPRVTRPLSWNHMYEGYPRQVAEAGAARVWESAPVHLETCWVPMTWFRHGWDLDFILQQGHKYHATYFMPKSTRLPEAWVEPLSAFCRRLGYRFILRHAAFDRQVKRGDALGFAAWVENVGVAPLYRRYDLALRFRQDDREAVVNLDGEGVNADARRWLPGDAWVERRVPLPEGLRPGWVELAAALVDPTNGQAKVSFAVKEQFGDRWVDLAGFELM